MRSLLDALQEGRLIELPDSNKHKALEYLATLIEAIPDISVEGGITESVLAREQQHNTGIGKGWGCPHARSTHDGELLCAVGWSPTGIDYGSPDNEAVHIVVMYFVPDTQKNAYLKEISSLAKAIMTQPEMQDLKSLTDLGEVRHRLLDAISVALESTAPEAKARMIQLEARHTEAAGAAIALPADIARRFIPLSILVLPGMKPVVLSQDREIVSLLEGREGLTQDLAQQGQVEAGGVRILLRAASNYQPDRVLYECLAFKVNGQPVH